MQENTDNLPRNLLFMIALAVSAVAAYFLNASLFMALKMVFNIEVQANFTRLLDQSSLWGVASYWSTFALLMFILAFLLPAISNIFGLIALKNKISELPRAGDKAANVTKDKFLKAMSGFKLVYADFAVPYAHYIIEKQEKDIRKKTKFLGKGKAPKARQPEILVTVPASKIFLIERVLSSRLSIWFMRSMPRVLIGIGLLLFLLSIAGSLQTSSESLLANDMFLMGISSLSLCLGVGVLLAALFRVIVGHVMHRAAEIVKMIENLFVYKAEEGGVEDFKAVEMALSKTVSSFKDVSKAINEKQEEAVNKLIVNTLDDYVKKINSANKAQSEALQKIVDDTTKQSVEVSDDLTKRFDDYANKIAEIQKNLDDHQDKSYQTLTDKIEMLITSLNEEVSKASVAALHKDAILDDLNKTAEDLGSISKASDAVTDKFDLIAIGLDRVIEQVEKIAPMSEETKEHITLGLDNLKKQSSKTVGMGRRSPAKSRKKA